MTQPSPSRDLDDTLPILIGVGQTVIRDNTDIETAHPVRIISDAVSRALADIAGETYASTMRDHVDCVAVIRSFADSLPFAQHNFGAVKNLPAAVIKASSLTPKQIIYSAAGGEQPQALVAELATKLLRGEIGMAVIAGGEVTGAMKAAQRAGRVLNWADETALPPDGDYDDRGAQTDFISGYEIANGLGLPPQTYGAMEQALRARLGYNCADYNHYVAGILSRYSRVAALHDYAQFPDKKSAKFLATPSPENYPTFAPYLKWHMAQDAVNQGAALVMTTVGKARDLGVDPAQWIFLHGAAACRDSLVSQRPDLSRSDAVSAALDGALSSAGLSVADISVFDIYSCFPVLVHIAAEHLGLDPLTTDLTVTGGLPFFGGAGNNYSTHAIATLVERLRAAPDQYGLILANGGFMSKEAVGIYSAVPPQHGDASADMGNAQARIDGRDDIPMLSKDCEAVVEGYTVQHGRAGPMGGYVIALNGDDRVIARLPADDAHMLNVFANDDHIVGGRISVRHKNGVNIVSTFTPPEG